MTTGSRTSLACLLLGAATLVGCSDRSDPILYLEANGSLQIQPSAVVVDDGNALDIQITIRDGSGNRVAALPEGARTEWASFAPSVARVSGSGLAGRLEGLRPGTTKLRVSLGSLTATADVHVTAIPHQLLAQGPSVGLGLANEPSPQPARVQVQDRHGSPVKGASVAFEVVSGGGRVERRTAVSDAFGFAETPWTLGPDLGLQTVAARVAGGPSTQLYRYVNGDLATVTLSAVPGAGVGTVGRALPEMLEIRARDAQGRPVLGLGVEWSTSSGQALPTSPVTDVNGRARARWILGPTPGLQTASVRLSDPVIAVQGQSLAADVTLTFQAQAQAAEAVRISALPDRVVLPLGNAARVNAAVLDALGNRIADPYSLTWTFLDPGVGSISADATGDALVSGTRLGQTRLVVTQGALSDTVDIIVQPTGGGEDPGSGTGPSVLTLAPTHINLVEGQSGEFQATLRDGNGQFLPTTDALWTSDIPTVATVDGVGRVTAVGEGATLIRVSLGALQATATVFVTSSPAPDDGPPTQITDVRIVDATETSLDVAFTAGNDGSGAPALHEIRYSASPMGWGWGQATVVSAGACASPIQPSSVGAAMVCRVAGLAPGRSYDLRMVSWREAPDGRIFSPLSNIARGSTLVAEDPGGNVDVVEITPANAILAPGASIQSRATVYDASGVELEVPVSWSSTNTAVAEVDGTGRVTAVAAGSVTIRATAGGRSGFLFVSVTDSGQNDEIASVTIQPTSFSMAPGESTQLTAQARTSAGEVISGVDFFWTSDNPGIATVNGTGRVTAVAGGSVTIRAEADEKVGTALITVENDGGDGGNGGGGAGAPAFLVITPGSATLSAGSSMALVAQAFDVAGLPVTGVAFNWTSDSPSIASVNALGIVTGQAPGVATIRATGANLTATAQISVASVGTPGAVWYRQDWNYSSITDLLSQPELSDASNSGGRVSLISNAAGPGFQKAVRVQFDANAGGEPQAGVDIFFPNAGRDRPREIWFEYYARFSSNWEVNGPYSGSAGHKHLFLFDQEQTGVGRWEHIVGLFGNLMSMSIAGNLGPGGQQLPFQPNIRSLWDGNWHLFRCHARMHSSAGAWECEIDGQRFSWGTGDTDRGAQYYFNQMSLSRNLNKGTDRTMTLDFGPVTVYTSSPGWQ